MSSPRVATSLAVVLGTTLGAGAALVTSSTSGEYGQAPPLIPELVPRAAEPMRVAPAATTTRPASSGASGAEPADSVTRAAAPAEPKPAEADLPLREQPLEPSESAVLAAALNCARGEPDDCLRTAEAYEAGRGVKTSPEQARSFRASAIKRYAEACTARDPDACHALATLRATGRGLAQNVEAAEALMERARQACRTRPSTICQKLRER